MYFAPKPCRNEKKFDGLLVLASWHGVRIFAERAGIAFRQNFHHPSIKVVHRMIHDGFESSVVFAVSFLNVVFQSYANVFVFAAQANLIRS